ncbi:MAG: ATP-binding protein [Actinomycetota bacterium]|nr:ATP-binding protein [Actinomycetota bacterium]
MSTKDVSTKDVSTQVVPTKDIPTKGVSTKGVSTTDTAPATRERPQASPPLSRAAGQPAPRRLRMAGDAASVRDARRFVEDAMAASPSDVRDIAVLLAGEVVTNAVVHGGGWFCLEVDAAPDRLRVQVTDSGAGLPRVLKMNGEREHGRGMAIVDAIATMWGTEQLGTHKVVWFELDLMP